MNKILILGIIGLLLISGVVVIENLNEKEIEYKTGIDTGITPEQTWQIIHGENIGEVLNLRKINK